jgi:hypothetical protein
MARGGIHRNSKKVDFIQEVITGLEEEIDQEVTIRYKQSRNAGRIAKFPSQ